MIALIPTCLADVRLLMSYMYISSKHDNHYNETFASCPLRSNSAICFHFSEEEMKAATNECRDDKVKSTMSSYCFLGTSGPKGIPG